MERVQCHLQALLLVLHFPQGPGNHPGADQGKPSAGGVFKFRCALSLFAQGRDEEWWISLTPLYFMKRASRTCSSPSIMVTMVTLSQKYLSDWLIMINHSNVDSNRFIIAVLSTRLSNLVKKKKEWSGCRSFCHSLIYRASVRDESDEEVSDGDHGYPSAQSCPTPPSGNSAISHNRELGLMPWPSGAHWCQWCSSAGFLLVSRSASICSIHSRLSGITISAWSFPPLKSSCDLLPVVCVCSQIHLASSDTPQSAGERVVKNVCVPFSRMRSTSSVSLCVLCSLQNRSASYVNLTKCIYASETPCRAPVEQESACYYTEAVSCCRQQTPCCYSFRGERPTWIKGPIEPQSKRSTNT